jgi:hypothetical protein
MIFETGRNTENFLMYQGLIISGGNIKIPWKKIEENLRMVLEREDKSKK